MIYEEITLLFALQAAFLNKQWTMLWTRAETWTHLSLYVMKYTQNVKASKGVNKNVFKYTYLTPFSTVVQCRDVELCEGVFRTAMYQQTYKFWYDFLFHCLILCFYPN